jgi:predicted nucleotidyltransferase
MKESQFLDKIKSTLSQTGTPLSIYLYGSRARGDARPNSDWDLLVILENNNLTDEIEDEIFSVIYKMELETGQIISPYFLNKQDYDNRIGKTPFYRNLSNEGILL